MRISDWSSDVCSSDLAWCADPRVALHNYYAPQGIGADIIATIDGFTREDVDRYAAASQRRAAKSWDEGNFSKSVIPVTDGLGNVLLDNDEYSRSQTTDRKSTRMNSSH